MKFNLIYASLVMAIATAVVLSACGPDPDTDMTIETPNSRAMQTGRVQVTRVGVLNDSLAYGDRRGIYVIKDLETGKEFIGISGIGISETGSHSNGKSSIRDER